MGPRVSCYATDLQLRRLYLYSLPHPCYWPRFVIIGASPLVCYFSLEDVSGENLVVMPATLGWMFSRSRAYCTGAGLWPGWWTQGVQTGRPTNCEIPALKCTLHMRQSRVQRVHSWTALWLKPCTGGLLVYYFSLPFSHLPNYQKKKNLSFLGGPCFENLNSNSWSTCECNTEVK